MLDLPVKRTVRLYNEVALIRYRSQIEIMVQGQKYPRGRYWHTDAYEKHLLTHRRLLGDL
jgi:hypothetical protein